MSHTSPNDDFLHLFGTPYDRVPPLATAASTHPCERGSISGLATAASALAPRSPGPFGVSKSSSSHDLQTSIARWEESVHAFHFDDLGFNDHHQSNTTTVMEDVASSSSCSGTVAEQADEASAIRARSASLDFWGMDLSAPTSLYDEGHVVGAFKASSVESVEQHEPTSSVIKVTAPKRKQPCPATTSTSSTSTTEPSSSDSIAPMKTETKRAWRQPARSCLPCRQKKSRCDRREQCSSCTSREIQCVWTGVARPLTEEELLAEAEAAILPAPTAASSSSSSFVAKSGGPTAKASRVGTVSPPRLPSKPPIVATAAAAAPVQLPAASMSVSTIALSSPDQVEIERLRTIIKSLAHQLQLDAATLLDPSFVPQPLTVTAVPPPAATATTSSTSSKRRRSDLGPLTLPSPPALSYGSSSDSSSSCSSILGQVSPELPFVSPTLLPAHQTRPQSKKRARASSYGFDDHMLLFAGQKEEISDAWLNPSSWLTAIPKTLMH